METFSKICTIVSGTHCLLQVTYSNLEKVVYTCVLKVMQSCTKQHRYFSLCHKKAAIWSWTAIWVNYFSAFMCVCFCCGGMKTLSSVTCSRIWWWFSLLDYTHKTGALLWPDVDPAQIYSFCYFSIKEDLWHPNASQHQCSFLINNIEGIIYVLFPTRAVLNGKACPQRGEDLEGDQMEHKILWDTRGRWSHYLHLTLAPTTNFIGIVDHYCQKAKQTLHFIEVKGLVLHI